MISVSQMISLTPKTSYKIDVQPVNSRTKSYADFYVDVLMIFYKIIAEPRASLNCLVSWLCWYTKTKVKIAFPFH